MDMKALVGYTGFVGGNIDAKADFDKRYNSKNIEEAYGTKPDLLVYAGLRAEKYLANNEPEKDLARCREAFENIAKIEPKKLVLISTADVYKVPVGVNEDTPVDTEDLHAYGLDRYRLEQWVKDAFPDASIVRLPALYGKGIKKNFVYDFIKRIPFMLTEKKFAELTVKDPFIVQFYEDQGNGFYKCHYDTEEERLALKDYFDRAGFSALQFTDSRSMFQFYPLARLWSDIQTVLANDLRLVNIVTEPETAGEVYEYVTEQKFVNEMSKAPVVYDIHSKYAELFGGSTPYMMDKASVLADLKKFILSSN